jgi:hypothetical protein
VPSGLPVLVLAAEDLEDPLQQLGAPRPVRGGVAGGILQ